MEAEATVATLTELGEPSQGTGHWMQDTVVTSDQVLRAIRRLLQRSVEHSRVLARRTGLTVPQILCLRAVHELPPELCTVAHAAEHADLAVPTASRILTQLVDADLLRREHTPSDRRKVFLALTDNGRARLDETIGGVHPQFVSRFQSLSPDEQAQLLAALTQIVDMMELTDGA